MAHEKEDALYDRWMRARELRDRGPVAKRQHYYELADKLQYELQDVSAYGNSLVFGSREPSRKSKGAYCSKCRGPHRPKHGKA